MSYMFKYFIFTKNVIDMTAMFSTCKNLENLNLSNFDTNKLIKYDGIFANCEIETFNITSFNKFDKEKLTSCIVF